MYTFNPIVKNFLLGIFAICLIKVPLFAMPPVTANFALHKTHSKAKHTVIATAPNVCKTPTPGGPVPIPYPNISFLSNQKDIKKGDKIIFQVKGKNLERYDHVAVKMSNGSSIFYAELEPLNPKQKNVTKRKVTVTVKGNLISSEKYHIKFGQDLNTKPFFSRQFAVSSNK